MSMRYVLSLLIMSAALGSDYSDAWGPGVGVQIPAGSFVSHDGDTRAFLELAGDKGLLILFNRSANW